ncbi:MAG TPA: DoxX family protein [Candidatus Acidoferrum sp.]|jgi:putative oxidoreductase|nr:DoxX family protein [Candidatus Acidoferrum sp.]
MASNSISTSAQGAPTARAFSSANGKEQAAAGSLVTLAGRILFSAIFIMSGFLHFSQAEIGYAAQAGVPMARLLVPASGLLALAGGLSILLGYRAKIGGWLLVLFLVPVTLMMHNFWAVKNPMMAQIQMAMFLKNVTIIGGALLISQFGTGALSLDARRNSSR